MAKKRRARKNPNEELVAPGPSPDTAAQIVPVLQGYFDEADTNRKNGLNSRDDKWEDNLHLYWNRHDFSDKAAWQAQETMPEVPAMVDRFAAALKEALVASPNAGFFTVVDAGGQEDQTAQAIKAMTETWLLTTGQNFQGTILGFPAVFEEQVKMGALTAMSSVVKWNRDTKYGRVAIETVDPRHVWLDHTGRNLYRIRRVQLDKHALIDMATQRDGNGQPIWNLEAIQRMTSHLEAEDIARREQMTGTGQEVISTRQPIIMDEYIATVVSGQGKVLAKDALMVVGNKQFLIRGPEPNPFWHGKDWLTYTPLVVAPLSVYGRTYMEDFGSLAKTFQNLTNMILDAVQTSSIKAYALVPSMLLKPEQAATGLWPNKFFLLEDGMKPEDFFKALDLGTLPPEAVQVWQAMKSELREAGDLNEIALGQMAPKGRTSATEINSTQESSSALIRSVAQTVEARWLNPTLDLVWQTGIQHMSLQDPTLRAAVGDPMFEALFMQRRELSRLPYRFQAHGISMLIQKQRMMKALLGLLQIIAQSEPLLAVFLQEVDLTKLMHLLFTLNDIDLRKMTLTEQERLIKSFQEPMQLAQGRMNGPTGPMAPRADAGAAAGVVQALAGLGLNKGQGGPAR